jgi:hypothetical protein
VWDWLSGGLGVVQDWGCCCCSLDIMGVVESESIAAELVMNVVFCLASVM